MSFFKRILLIGYAIVAILIIVAGFALFWQTLVEYDVAFIPVSGFAAPIPVPISQKQVRTIYSNEKPISVTVVDTPETRAKGLSGKDMLGSNDGMLFIFPENGVYGFWMKDMLFPIDIVWISVDKRVLHIDKNVSPDTYPQVFEPPSPIRYVLELPAGQAEEYTVHPGSVLEF